LGTALREKKRLVNVLAMENVFNIAEQFVQQMEPQVGTDTLEHIIGVLVLMAASKQVETGGSGIDNINFVLGGSEFRLVTVQ